MAKYSGLTDLELVQFVQTAYKDATALCYENNIPHYSHDANGIGCAIGCFLPAGTARVWDTVGPIVYLFEHGNRTPLGNNGYSRFFAESQLPVLGELQLLHDGAETLEEFQTGLAELIGTLSQPGERSAKLKLFQQLEDC